MTEINTREIAEHIILDAARDVEHLTISEHLSDEDGYDDLPEAEQDELADEIHALIDKATVTVTFPEATGS